MQTLLKHANIVKTKSSTKKNYSMLNTDNFTTFLPIFPFQTLFKVREKSESFEGFFSGKNIFGKTYARVTLSANS